MDKLYLNIKSDNNIFFRQLLHLFRSFAPIKDLTEGEINVLAEIMRLNNHYHDKIKEDHIRRNLIFSQDSRKEMCDKLGMSRDTFNNYLSFLRKKKILDKNNMLIKALNIFPTDTFEFKVTFNFNNNG